MIFKAFRIKNYKSFIDSGRCSVQNGVTILAGQNESGKTNILSALEKLNEKEPAFTVDEFSFDNTNVSPEITYWFGLTDEEIEAFGSSFPGVTLDREITAEVQNKKRLLRYYAEEEIEDGTDALIISYLESLLPKFVLYRTLENDIPDSFTVKELSNVAIKRLATYLNADFKMIFETANQQAQRRLTQSLSTSISSDFSAKYKQKNVELEFDINSGTISMYVYDKEATGGNKGYPFRLSQRSTGLKWYLNFYVALKGENLKAGDIILVDEPGMYLHPKAQQEMRDILNEESAVNQIIYTTHSPYLIDSDNISQLRLVEKRSDIGEYGYNEISEIREKVHHSRNIDTLKPIADAIGYSLSSELNLQHKKVLVCEGVSDYYYIKALELLFGKQLNCGITHANGCNNIWKVASLFLGLGIPEIFALVDSDGAGIKERTKLIKDGVFDEASFFTTHEPSNVGKAIEDIFIRDYFLREILEYTEDEIKKADAVLSKEIGKQPNGTKYALAKKVYEKANVHTLAAADILAEDGRRLFEKLEEAVNAENGDV